jgi:hypothetical protein
MSICSFLLTIGAFGHIGELSLNTANPRAIWIAFQMERHEYAGAEIFLSTAFAMLNAKYSAEDQLDTATTFSAGRLINAPISASKAATSSP